MQDVSEEKPEQPQSPSLEGAVPPLSNLDERMRAMDDAFDYRGDVTIHTADGRAIEGYIFDRRRNVPEPYIRMMPRDGSPRVQVRYADITRLEFTGKDTAAGKSWETWLKKWHEKKARGESAELHPEPLEEA